MPRESATDKIFVVIAPEAIGSGVKDQIPTLEGSDRTSLPSALHCASNL